MAFAFVGLGGLLGAIARYEIGRQIAKRMDPGFPVATLLVNITGAILLGLVTGFDTGGKVYLLIGDGFLGAFTTFSTFMYEGFHLIKGTRKLNAAVYIGGSIVVGIAGYFIGWQLGRLFGA